MKPNRRKIRLQKRINDWTLIGTFPHSEAKVRKRKESGGYRCPGSYKR